MKQILFLITIFLNFVISGRCIDVYRKNDFPDGFIFGSAISAFQWEGAVDEDGRTPSIWDTFANSSKGDKDCDGYHKYKEDVKLMYEMGLDAFRFSISWPRLIPSGRGPVNPKGLRFYKSLIAELKRHGIEPHVTLYHNDLPQVLEDEYGGWIDAESCKKVLRLNFTKVLHPLVFGDYPEVMKRIVGDRLPSFSEEESDFVKNSFDFLGLIHYTTLYTTQLSSSHEVDYMSDMNAALIPIGNSTFAQFDVLPWGLEGVLEYIKQDYENPPIYILENGQPTNHYSSLHDVGRVNYLHAYIASMLKSVRNGSDTRGYFQWSFMDLYEFIDTNYTYGLYYVNFSDPERKRTPKLSAFWYSAFLNNTSFLDSQGIEQSQSNFSSSATSS